MQLEEILELVKADLRRRLDKSTIDDYEQIPFETVKALLADDDILIYGEFKDALVSPWAIAKYMYLYSEEAILLKQVEEDLSNLLPANIEYCFIKHLSCNIQFMHKFRDGFKKQVLIIKYYLDEDNKIQYKLTNAGNSSCWDITRNQLKALLASEILIPEKVIKLKLKNKLIRWIKMKLWS